MFSYRNQDQEFYCQRCPVSWGIEISFSGIEVRDSMRNYSVIYNLLNNWENSVISFVIQKFNNIQIVTNDY